MNELIKISDKQTISARELHEYLEVGTAYKDWFPRMCEYGFIEGTDFCSFLSESTGGRPSTDHEITIDMAKEICMLQRSEKGKQARLYFIEVEKQAKQPKQMTQSELIFGLAQCNVELEKKVLTLDSKVTNALEVFTKAVEPSWKESMNKTLNGLIETNGLNYQTFKGGLYKELDRTAHVLIGKRQKYLRNRMKQAGHTVAEQKAVSKLDIIDSDPKLRVIFEGIVRKYQAKYAVQRFEA